MADFDKLDLQILDILKSDGRKQYNEIGDQIGVTGNTVRRRMDRMEDNEIIEKYTVLTDSFALGYLTVAFGLTVEAGYADRIAEKFSKYDFVYKLGILSGAHSIIFEADFRDRDHLQDFVNNALNNTEGISNYDNYVVTRHVKNNPSVVFLQDD